MSTGRGELFIVTSNLDSITNLHCMCCQVSVLNIATLGWVWAVSAKTTQFSHHLGCGSQQSTFILRMRFLRFQDISDT